MPNTHSVSGRSIEVVAVVASVWTHKELPADLAVELHPKLGYVTRLTLEQFYAYVNWSNGVPGVEKPTFADFVGGANLMASVDHHDGRGPFDTWAKWWFQPATRLRPQGEAGLGLGAYGDSICWEHSNRIVNPKETT